jgi:hypothetical protein
LPLFGGFALSKAHAKEEVKQIRRWNIALFKHAPDLLDDTYGEEGARPYKEYLARLEGGEAER